MGKGSNEGHASRQVTRRRDFIKVAAGGAALAGLPWSFGCQSRPGRARQERPNIVYLMTDQQKASASSAYGNRHVPTPFVDEMAESGIVFKDAHVTSPICTPSRTSVFTGVHPLVHQVTCHQNRAPYRLPQLSEILQQAGYYTAAAGHYEDDRNLTRGWHEAVSHDEVAPLKRSFDLWFSHGRRDVAWSSGRMECSPEEAHAAVLTDRVIHMLEGIRADGSPFFLHVPYLEPHPPYFAPPPYDTIVKADELDVPDQGRDDGRPAWQFEVRKQCGTAKATPDDIRRMMAVYYGMIAFADSQMQRLYSALEKRGLLENTWIIISSDHGDYLGEKGLFMKTESLYECLLHVPLVIRPPTGMNAPRGVQISGLVDMTDLFSTILAIAGVETPEYAQGKDLIAWVSDSAREPLRDCVFSQVGDYHGNLKSTFPSGLPEAGRHPGLLQGARTMEFSYVRDPDYGDEAYHLRSDPKELSNLLQSTAGSQPPQVADLRRRVEEWEEQCLRLRERLGVIPGYRGFD